MRLVVERDGSIVVTLSARNLRALLATLEGQACSLGMGRRLKVFAEPDAVHYAGREVSPATEEAIELDVEPARDGEQ